MFFVLLVSVKFCIVFSAFSNELLYLPHVCIVSCQEGPLPAKSSSQILSSEICMIFKQPDEVYTSKYIERTPHYIYFTTWSLINLRSSGLLSAISIAYESNCSATRLSGGLAASFSIKDSAPECKDSLLPVSGGYPQLPHLTQHPSGLQELHALLHHLVQVGQNGQYVGLDLCVRLHLERKQR